MPYGSTSAMKNKLFPHTKAQPRYARSCHLGFRSFSNAEAQRRRGFLEHYSVFLSTDGHRLRRLFLGQGWPRVASKSTARLFHAKARRHEGWRASVPTSRLPLRGRMGGTSVARPRASRRLPLPVLSKPDGKCWRAASGWRAKTGNFVAFVAFV